MSQCFDPSCYKEDGSRHLKSVGELIEVMKCMGVECTLQGGKSLVYAAYITAHVASQKNSLQKKPAKAKKPVKKRQTKSKGMHKAPYTKANDPCFNPMSAV